MSERKNFSTKVIEEVYSEQGGVCANCDRVLINGYHTHHKNSDASDNSKENCQLVCPSCHGGKQYETLQEQKRQVISDLDKLISVGIDGKASGATIEKLLDAIKLKLSLQRQTTIEDTLEPPASVKMETYVTVQQELLKRFEQGFIEGLTKGIELIKEKKEVKK